MNELLSEMLDAVKEARQEISNLKTKLAAHIEYERQTDATHKEIADDLRRYCSTLEGEIIRLREKLGREE